MIEFRVVASAAEASADAIIVGVGASPDLSAAWALDQMPWMSAVLDAKDFHGKPGELVVIPTAEATTYSQVAFVGIGEAPTPEVVRRGTGAAVRALAKATTVVTSLHQAVVGGAGAVAMGAALGAYNYDKHKSEKSPSSLVSITLAEGTESDLGEALEAVTISNAVIVARDLVNEPAMYKSPVTMAGVASTIASDNGLTVRVLDENEIDAERLGGLRGVSLGAANPPRLVELRYEPEGASRFLAIVGKGIVFDSGGLSLKPAASMEEMKTDMSGAAAVFGAMQAIASLGLPIKVVGITPITENMPGGAALRPGDVLKIRNGKTIEVLNTDAEGRLVLADGLSLAVEQEPDLVVDLATLTGACMVALGKKIAGVLGTDEAVDQVIAAADAAGERVWRLPLPEDYRPMIDSDIADMKNSGERWGGAITAGLLLQEFVGDVPWAHLDIAGPARAADTDGYILKGGTGFGVRTIVELARQMSSV